jgi:hypothetical protein
MSESGFGSSSRRNTSEIKLATDAQSAVDRSRELTAFNTQGYANTAAGEVGGGVFNAKAGDYSFGARPLFTGGKAGITSGASSPLYSISPSIVSSFENQHKVDVARRKGELQSAYVGNRAFNFS